MLKHTFCHLPGIGPTTEEKLWKQGILTWEDALNRLDPAIKKEAGICNGIRESMEKLDQRDAVFFQSMLPAGQHYRLFNAFRKKSVFLDIETTGLSSSDKITTIATYDGNQIRYYIQGENLDQFLIDIQNYEVIISFNGKTFDIPFIQTYFNCSLDQAHIDLRYVLASLGYKGGLKKCEKALGIDRGALDGVDGYFAVVLWHEYQKTGNKKALETLLAYNIEDVINLEILMVRAYNQKLQEKGFSNLIQEPGPVDNLFIPDEPLIDRLRPAPYYFS